MRKAGLVAILMLAGCLERPGIRPLRPLEIATAPYREIATTTVVGTLMYEGGCLIFRDERTGVLLTPVLPTGSSFNGTAIMFHLPGKSDQWVAIAQEVLLYGRPLQWVMLDSAAYQPVRRQCGIYGPFYVTAVTPAD